MGEPSLLRTPTGLSDHLSDDKELKSFEQWRQGPGEQIHKALGAESHYDKQRMAFTVKKPYHDLKDVLDACKQAGQSFEFEVLDCTWGDVIGQMQKAQDVYKAKGDENHVRALFRHGHTMSNNVIPWLDMIPDQYGLSILHAGLTMIFHAVQQREANREKIFQAFKSIPEIIEKAQTTRQYYPKEESLHENATALYKMLLEEMPQLIKILLRKHNAFFLKRWANQIPGHEQAFIERSVGKVNKGYVDLKNCLDNIQHKKIAHTDQNMTENLRETKAIRQTAVSTHVRVADVSKDLTMVGANLEAHREESKLHLDEVENKVEESGMEVKNHITRTLNEVGEELQMAIEKKIDDRMDDVKRQYQISQHMAVETVDMNFATTIQTGIWYIVMERVYYQGYSQPQINRSPSPTYQKISTFDILEILKVPYDTANTDLRFVLRQSKSFKTDALGHGRWLMTTTRFKNWLGGGRSDILLVDGHGDSAKSGKTSPMSVFCSTFIASVIKLHTTIVLHFFCGQHVTFVDPLRGAHGLLRSLICQLLLYPNTQEPNLDSLSQQKLYNDLRAHELNALRHLFQQLVQQLPRGTLVFCIIDGISEYETKMNNSTENLQLVVDTLQSIVRDHGLGGPTFKVLMTSANRSTEIVKKIPPQDCISLRAGNVHSGLISEQAFFAEISKAKAALEAADPQFQRMPWTETHLLPE
ncbi:uncharacterized protein LY89DRAFT_149357 [Mollisia scopiformis]|uniref:Nephrocystin 3-like N-terminal domain-containing protein n=1 Tax=Mollisia scopiformis TaxID=149040 RepID=A0A194X222_MOLSC|nr:uncharacterized protein LY89DRAFT_149357 [Mollisia scopiformis]KUJ13892.1 hypothetical protein LY89DRAFT_149357 [Mollisia scopiformis]